MRLRFSVGMVLAVLAAMVAAAAVIYSIWLNPPSLNRARTLDHLRLQGLMQTQNTIQGYFGIHHALPPDLTALENGNGYLASVNWHDPETHRPFDYVILDATSYKLCTDFSLPSDTEDQSYDPSFTKHSGGHDCIQRNVRQAGTQF